MPEFDILDFMHLPIDQIILAASTTGDERSKVWAEKLQTCLDEKNGFIDELDKRAVKINELETYISGVHALTLNAFSNLDYDV